MSEAMYLGDGVYATKREDGAMVLSTASHLKADAEDVIVLESEHLNLLYLFFRGTVSGDDAGEGGFQ